VVPEDTSKEKRGGKISINNTTVEEFHLSLRCERRLNAGAFRGEGGGGLQDVLDAA